MTGHRESDAGDIFMVRARRCKRCGGLLTSSKAVADGYGHVCMMKELGEREAKEPLPGQINLLDDMEGDKCKGQSQ